MSMQSSRQPSCVLPNGTSRRTSRLRPTAIAAVVLVGAALVASCDRSSGSTGSPTQNASATDVQLTVTSNAIAGGKNAAQADWITDFVIPGFTAFEKAKGINVTVNFQATGVDDEPYKQKTRAGPQDRLRRAT